MSQPETLRRYTLWHHQGCSQGGNHVDLQPMPQGEWVKAADVDKLLENIQAVLGPFAERAEYFDRVLRANNGVWPDDHCYADDPSPGDTGDGIYIGQLRKAQQLLTLIKGGQAMIDDELDQSVLYEEVVAMLAGSTRKIPTMAHLQALRDAMQEHHEVCLIRIANELDVLKRRVLEMS